MLFWLAFSYDGFGTGRAAYLYCGAHLAKKAEEVHGVDGFAAKKAKRAARAAKKLKRESEQQKKDDDAAQAKPAVKKAKTAASKAKDDAQRQGNIARNQQLLNTWDLTVTLPASVAGEKGAMTLTEFDSCLGGGDIDIGSVHSPAFVHGTLYGFKGASTLADKVVKIESRWKVMGRRWSGCLSLSVLPDGTIAGKLNSGVSGDEYKVVSFTGVANKGAAKEFWATRMG